MTVKALPALSFDRLDDFWSRVRIEEDCWLYTGPFGGGGDYGLFRIDGRYYLAHRLSYKIATGVDPGAGLVCHHCDTPPCVRPEHLYLGDKRTNMVDAVERGLRTYEGSPAGEAHPGAKLTTGQVREMRRLHAEGAGGYDRLAGMFGVSKATVGHVITGRKWRTA